MHFGAAQAGPSELIENPRFMLIHSFQSADDKFALQPHSRPIF